MFVFVFVTPGWVWRRSYCRGNFGGFERIRRRQQPVFVPPHISHMLIIMMIILIIIMNMIDKMMMTMFVIRRRPIFVPLDISNIALDIIKYLSIRNI